MLKIGFFEYDFVIGNVIVLNLDICCFNDDCIEVMWVNLRWSYKDFGLNLWNFFIKDIVNVFWGGYVVVRIVVDNLGIVDLN